MLLILILFFHLIGKSCFYLNFLVSLQNCSNNIFCSEFEVFENFKSQQIIHVLLCLLMKKKVFFHVMVKLIWEMVMLKMTWIPNLSMFNLFN